MKCRSLDGRSLPADESGALILHVDPIEYALEVSCALPVLRGFLTRLLGVKTSIEHATDTYFDSLDYDLHRQCQSVRLRSNPGQSVAVLNVGWSAEKQPATPRENCVVGYVFDDPTDARLRAYLEARGFVAVHQLQKRSDTYVMTPRRALTASTCPRISGCGAVASLRHVASGFSVSLDEIFVAGAQPHAVLEIEFSPAHAAQANVVRDALLRRFGDGLREVARNKIDRILRARAQNDSPSTSFKKISFCNSAAALPDVVPGEE